MAVVRALGFRLPLLYLALIASIWLVAIDFHGSVPFWLTPLVPALVTIVMIKRMVDWRRLATEQDSDQALKKAIERIYLVGPIIAGFVMVWAATLYQMGDDMQRALIQQYVAITGVLCAICLLPAPRLAVTVAITGMGIAQFSFYSRPHELALESSLMQAVTMAVILVVAFRYREESDALVRARHDVQLQADVAQETAERQRELAGQDFLTGLLNRRAFQRILFERISDKSKRFTLALVDLDGFKDINDTHGHVTGDAVLRAMARRLKKHCKEAIAIGRLGGDEFAILAPGGKSFAKSARGLTKQLSEPIDAGGWKVRCFASIGYLEDAGGNLRADDMLERADRAMYEAKRTGRGVVAFDAKLEQSLVDRHSIRAAAMTGSLERQLELAYQPLFDLEKNEIAGFETLARWNAPGRPTMDTGTFVEIAEENGIIGQVSLAMMRRMLADIPKFNPRYRIGINLSGQDFGTTSTVDHLIDMAMASGIEPSRIVFEITETATIRDRATAVARMQLLKERGFRIALDDFGVGQSGLQRLVDLPVDAIKLDRAFAVDLHDNPRARAVVAASVALARELGLRITQEGIENESQLGAVQALGVQLAQGYLIGAPMPLDEALAFGEDRLPKLPFDPGI